MKISGTGRAHPMKKNKVLILSYVLLFVIFSISTKMTIAGCLPADCMLGIRRLKASA